MQTPAGYRPEGPPGFQTTRWSVILGTGAPDPDARRTSLEELCRVYWRPVYTYLRRRHGLAPHDAEDMTQAFFEYVIEHEVLPDADPDRGRFRSYLKGVLRNFVWARERWEGRQKRGGDRRFVPLDPEEGAEADAASPEEALDCEWARVVLDLAQKGARERLSGEGRDGDWDLFAAYAHRTDTGEETSYRELGESRGLSPKDVWRRVARVRQAIQEEMKQVVRDTVADDPTAEREVRALLELGGGT